MPAVLTDASGNLLEAINPITVPVATVAAAGSAIGNAAALVSGLNLVTGADDTKGVVLPATAPGKVVYVYSNQATNGLKVYPPVNSTLNDGSANSSLNMEGKTLAVCIGTNSTNWAMLFTVNT